MRFALLIAGALLAAPAAAGVIGRDDRIPLATLAASADPADRALAAAARGVGLLLCDNGRSANAILVAPRVIATSAHVFIAVLADVRAGRVGCRYHADGSPAGAAVMVDLASLRLGTERPIFGLNVCANSRDWALARLGGAPAGVTPLPLARGNAQPGMRAAIVAHGSGPGSTAARCTVRDTPICRDSGAALLMTDCDAEAGSSGGATLLFEDGRWVVGGITRGAAPGGGPVYDRASAYHMAAPVHGPVRAAIPRAP